MMPTEKIPEPRNTHEKKDLGLTKYPIEKILDP